MSEQPTVPAALDDLVKEMSDTKSIAFFYDKIRELVVVNYADRAHGEGVNCQDALAAAYARFSGKPVKET